MRRAGAVGIGRFLAQSVVGVGLVVCRGRENTCVPFSLLDRHTGLVHVPLFFARHRSLRSVANCSTSSSVQTLCEFEYWAEFPHVASVPPGPESRRQTPTPEVCTKNEWRCSVTATEKLASASKYPDHISREHISCRRVALRVRPDDHRAQWYRPDCR